MRIFNIDITRKGISPVVQVTEHDAMSRFFTLILRNGNADYEPPENPSYSVWYKTKDSTGWYDTIEEPDNGTHPAVVASGNMFTIEIAEAATTSCGELALMITGDDGYQLTVTGIITQSADIPGYDSSEVENYYNVYITEMRENAARAENAAATAIEYGATVEVDETAQQLIITHTDNTEDVQTWVTEAEAWAVGQRDGVDVPSTDETYHNNAKYYAQAAAQSAASLTVDTELSSTSTNPVQNKAIDATVTKLKNDLEENVSDLKSALTNAFKAENSSDIVCNQTFRNTGTGATVWFNYPIPAGQYSDGLYAMVAKTTGTTGTQTIAGYVRVKYSDDTSNNTEIKSEGVLYKIYINPNKTVSQFDFVGRRSADTTTRMETTWEFVAFTGSQIEKNRVKLVEMGYTVNELSTYTDAFTNIIEPTFESGDIKVTNYALVYSESTVICRVPSGIEFFGLPEVRVHLKDYTKYKFGYLYAANTGNWYAQRWYSNDYIFSGANNDRKYTFIISRVDGEEIAPEDVQGQLQFIYPQSKAQRDLMSFYKTFSVKDNLQHFGLFFTSGNGLAAGSNNSYTTDYIPVTPGMTLKCKLDVGASSGRYAVCYYNPTKTAFVSGVEGNQDGTNLTVPDGVGYVRFCNISASLSAAYVIFSDYTMQDQVRTKIADIEQTIIDGTSGTEYMQTGLARVTSELKGKSDLGNIVVIGFSTDQHIWTTNQKAAVRRGLQVLSRLTRNYPFDFICLGGDACEGGSQADTLNEILDNCIEIQEPLYDAWCPVVPITGNHDAAQNNSNMRGGMLFNAHFKRVANSGFLKGWDSTHTNGYWDSEAHQIRFIFFDDTTRADYTQTQRNNILSSMVSGTPSGYKMVIFSHHPLSQSLTDSHWQNPVYADDILVPYAGRIICCICGHSHADISETQNGILYIATTMAMLGTDQDGHTRTVGVEEETAFDTFVIDQTNKKIYALRYGYGSNRDWTYIVT